MWLILEFLRVIISTAFQAEVSAPPSPEDFVPGYPNTASQADWVGQRYSKNDSLSSVIQQKYILSINKLTKNLIFTYDLSENYGDF